MKVRKGGILLTSYPYVSVLYSEYRHVLCDYCTAQCSGTVHCTECNSVVYCSKMCMSQDVLHGLECELLVKSGYQPSTPTAWLLLRAWLRSEYEEEGGGEEVPGQDKKRTFSDFISHHADLRKDKKKMNQIAEHYRDLEHILLDEMPTFDEFLELYGKVVINNFELRQTGSGESYGMAVYLAPSIVDHSCVPNAWVEIVGKKLIMRSTVDIDKVEMKKVFFSYINTEAELDERQNYLKKYFFFSCDCQKCKNYL